MWRGRADLVGLASRSRLPVLGVRRGCCPPRWHPDPPCLQVPPPAGNARARLLLRVHCLRLGNAALRRSGPLGPGLRAVARPPHRPPAPLSVCASGMRPSAAAAVGLSAPDSGRWPVPRTAHPAVWSADLARFNKAIKWLPGCEAVCASCMQSEGVPTVRRGRSAVPGGSNGLAVLRSPLSQGEVGPRTQAGGPGASAARGSR